MHKKKNENLKKESSNPAERPHGQTFPEQDTISQEIDDYSLCRPFLVDWPELPTSQNFNQTPQNPQ